MCMYACSCRYACSSTYTPAVNLWCGISAAVHLVFWDNISLGLSVISPQPRCFTVALLYIFLRTEEGVPFHSHAGHSYIFFEVMSTQAFAHPIPSLSSMLSFSSSLNTSASWVLSHPCPDAWQTHSLFLQATLHLLIAFLHTQKQF